MNERKWLHRIEVRERYDIDDNEIIRMILNGLPAYDGNHQEWKYPQTLNLKSCSLSPKQQLHLFARYFDYNDLLCYEKDYEIRPCNKKPSSHSSGRKSQIDKEAFREAADKLWKKNPDLTIQTVIDSDETYQVLGTKSRNEKTLRNWIKDLAPNRKPGRRPAAK